MSREAAALLVGLLIAALSPAATYLVSRRRPQVDTAEATDTITAAAERVVRNLTSDNERLTREVDALRTRIDQLWDELRTAKAEVSSLRAQLARERVEHEETREQVATLLRAAGIDPHTPPGGTPIVGD